MLTKICEVQVRQCYSINRFSWLTNAGARPEAVLSTANSRHNFQRIDNDSIDIFGTNSFAALCTNPELFEPALSFLVNLPLSSPTLCPSGTLTNSHSSVSPQAKANFTTPIPEYIRNIARYALSSPHPLPFSSARKRTNHPQLTLPSALPRAPMSVYHAKISVLAPPSTICAVTDSSMALNGPISFPDGEMTPSTAASSRIQKLENIAKVIPDRVIKPAPNTSMLRRPRRSAKRVKSKEIPTSP